VPTVPGAPRNGLALARWTAPVGNGGSPILRYEVEARRSDGTAAGPVRTASAGTAQVAVTGLGNGTAYRFAVRAVNAVGAGAWSSWSDAVVPVGPAAAPAALTATPGPSGGAQTVRLTWTPPSRSGGATISGYRVTRQRLTPSGSADGAASVVVVPGSARATTFTAPAGSRRHARYRFTVQAVTAGGTGAGRSVDAAVR
jgi:predicted phage tail protein